MKYLKKFTNFKESLRIDVALINVDLNESLGLLYDNILKSINAEELDIFTTFHLPKDDFGDKLKVYVHLLFCVLIIKTFYYVTIFI
jgi:hypothetical protein